MNHRLRFRWEPDYGLALADVWCPGDHGGECDMLTVRERMPDDPHNVDECPTVVDPDDCCDCGEWVPTDECWAKGHMNEFVYNGDGWIDVLRSAIDLPWVAVEIDSCGPDGNDPIAVRVIAEVAE